MPSIGEWFGVYSSLRDNVGATAAATQAVRAQLESLRADIVADLAYNNKGIAQYLSEMVSGAGAGADPNLLLINETLKNLSDQGLIPLLTSFVNVDKTLGSGFSSLNQLLQVFLSDIDKVLAEMRTGIKDSAKAQQEIADKIKQLIDSLFAEHSPSLITTLISLITTVGPTLIKMLPLLPFFFQVFERLLPEQWSAKIIEGLGSYSDLALKAGGLIVGIVEAPMRELVKSAHLDLVDNLKIHAPAKIEAPIEAATSTIMLGHKYGLMAHGLAAAAEMISPLKALGMSEMAAYFADLAGFKPIAQAVAGSLIGGAITRPMRWWGNAVFTPEIPSRGDLETLVQKRVIDEQTMMGYLAYHGFPRDIADYFVQTVWRDPSVRDLALAMEDTTVDPSWLLPRIMRTGYSDEDAEQISRSLMQRSVKSTRNKVIGAAYAATSTGSITIDDYRTILDGLGLRPEAVDLELQAARIASHNDYTKDAISTYRRQYVNSVIDESSFSVALYALGISPERVRLILMDASAQIAPRIAREEAAQIEDTIREVQRYLIPLYRDLLDMGLINDDAFIDALVSAGISEQVASQAAMLERMKREAIAVRTKNKLAERELSKLYDEREEMYVEMYRREQIDAGALAGALAALGIGGQRVAAIVETERIKRIPPISRPPRPPSDAAERYIRDLAIQTLIAAFRTGKITEGVLKEGLKQQQLSAEEADAIVQLEVARKR